MHAAARGADLGVLHFQPEVVAFAGPLADAGEDGEPPWALAMRAINSVRMTVLPSPAPPNKPGLAAADERRQQVDHLDARLEDFRLRREIGDRRGVAVDGPVFFGAGRGRSPSIGSPSRLKTRPSVALPTGTRDRGAGVDAVHAADHAVGVAQGDAAHAAAAEVLLDLAGEVGLHALLLGHDLHGVVDRRQMVLGGTRRRRSSR